MNEVSIWMGDVYKEFECGKDKVFDGRIEIPRHRSTAESFIKRFYVVSLN